MFSIIVFFPLSSKALLYLSHVNLVAGELADLESRDVTRHQDIMVGTALDDDLRLIGGSAGFISGLVVHGVFQLPAIGCDLKAHAEEEPIKG